jgi:hypothetical protein
MKKLLWLVLVLLAAAALAAWRMPAGFALDQLRPQLAGLSWRDASGTVWDGEADGVTWRGLRLGRVAWDIRQVESWGEPRTRWGFTGEGVDYRVAGEVSVGREDRVELRDVQGALPAAWADLGGALPLVYLTGVFDLELARLRLEGGLPVAADGAMTWRDAGLGGAVKESLGDVGFHVETPDGGPVRFRFASVGRPPIAVDGLGELRGDAYTVDAYLTVPPGRDEIYELLEPAGERLPDGRLRFAFSGRLVPGGP